MAGGRGGAGRRDGEGGIGGSGRLGGGALRRFSATWAEGGRPARRVRSSQVRRRTERRSSGGAHGEGAAPPTERDERRDLDPDAHASGPTAEAGTGARDRRRGPGLSVAAGSRGSARACSSRASRAWGSSVDTRLLCLLHGHCSRRYGAFEAIVYRWPIPCQAPSPCLRRSRLH
jgi:hypothetical protein